MSALLLAEASPGTGGGLFLLVIYVGLALTVSFLCSILEAVLLTARLSELSAREEAGDRGAGLLLELKENRIDDAIASILILNTMAHTVGATMAGKQAARIWEEPMVTVFAAGLTLAVLLLTEIIPKTLGTVYASRLAGFSARTIRVLTVALRPVLLLTKTLTRLLARHGEKESITRREIRALVAMATRSGNLGVHESNALHNLTLLERILVFDVMTPRTVVKMMRASQTVRDLLNDDQAEMFSRIPLMQESKDQVFGYILQRDVIRETLRTGRKDAPLSKWMREVRYVPETASLGKALGLFLETREHLLVVVDEYGGVSGLVTLEDLLESILGVEIMDETDRVEDLRRSATELRDRRLRRHHELLAEFRKDPALPDDDRDGAGGDRMVNSSDMGPRHP